MTQGLNSEDFPLIPPATLHLESKPEEEAPEEPEPERELTIDDLKAALALLRQKNQSQYQQLQSTGHSLDPNGLMMTRLEQFINLALSEDQKAQLDFLFESAVEQQLEAALSEVRKRQLLEGVGGPLPPHPLKMQRG